ncbi:MAG: hypothetical protein K0S33_1643 [Bacteroidetes bacterium]|jgi:hypothetical protein|nr:hypothetical protein [Bacteroidota bacterium]
MRLIRSRVFINTAILLALFLVSVLVRLDNLKDPMGRHHEWLSGHVLSTVYIYEQDGAAMHYFAPVWTFNTEADRYIASGQQFKDKNNYTYYVSYPPMCFLLPHYLFKICFLDASVIGLRVMGLIVHFFTAFFIFLLVLKFFDKNIRRDFFLPAILAFGFYMFAAGNLWFHGHVFFADMLVPLFITSFLYVFLRVLKKELSTRKACLLLFVTCALGAYTEWQMLFVAFFASLVLFFKGFRDRKYFLYFIMVCIAALLPVFIVYMQYSGIAGSEELIEAVSNKYKQRSGGDAGAAEVGLSMQNSFSFQFLSEHYERNYALLLDYGWYALLLFFFLAAINRMLEKGAITLQQFLIFAIILASILLHHYAFFNFTAVHDFSTLKTSLLLSLFCGYVLGLMWVLFDLDGKRNARNGFIGFSVIIFGLFFHFSTQSYYKVNHRGKLDKNNIVIGEIVRKYIKPNEIVFCTISVSPETTWYAKRNIMTSADVVDATRILQQIDSKYNAQLVKMNASDYEVIKINTKGDTLGYVKKPFATLDCLK